jgi:hypothetical protein
MVIVAGRRPGDGAYGVVDWACGWLGVTYGGEKLLEIVTILFCILPLLVT